MEKLCCPVRFFCVWKDQDLRSEVKLTELGTTGPKQLKTDDHEDAELSMGWVNLQVELGWAGLG